MSMGVRGFEPSGPSRDLDLSSEIEQLFEPRQMPQMWYQLMARLRSWLPEIEPCVTWRNGQAAPICVLRLPGPADGRGASAPKIEAGEAGVACVVSSRAGPIHGELAVHRNGADGPVWADLIGCLAVHRERLVQALDFASLVLELSVGLGIVKALLEADGHAAVIIGPDCSTLYYNGAAEAEFAAGDLLMRAPDGRLRLPGLVEPVDQGRRNAWR